MAKTLYTGTAEGPGTVTSETQTRHLKGVRLFLNITDQTGAGSLNVKLQVYDAAAEEWIDLPGATFEQQTGLGQWMLTVHPNIAAVANVAVSQYVGSPWRVSITEAGADTTFTFTVAYVPLS